MLTSAQVHPNKSELVRLWRRVIKRQLRSLGRDSRSFCSKRNKGTRVLDITGNQRRGCPNEGVSRTKLFFSSWNYEQRKLSWFGHHSPELSQSWRSAQTRTLQVYNYILVCTLRALLPCNRINTVPSPTNYSEQSPLRERMPPLFSWGQKCSADVQWILSGNNLNPRELPEMRIYGPTSVVTFEVLAAHQPGYCISFGSLSDGTALGVSNPLETHCSGLNVYL